MKRPVTYWLLIYSIFLLAILGIAFIEIDRETPESTRIFVTTTFAALAHMEGKLNPTGPSNDHSARIVIRPGLVPSFDFGFLGRHFLAVGSKIFSFRPRINTLGFFFPAMILLFFFQFYQSSRTSSEGEPGISMLPNIWVYEGRSAVKTRLNRWFKTWLKEELF